MLIQQQQVDPIAAANALRNAQESARSRLERDSTPDTSWDPDARHKGGGGAGGTEPAASTATRTNLEGDTRGDATHGGGGNGGEKGGGTGGGALVSPRSQHLDGAVRRSHSAGMPVSVGLLNRPTSRSLLTLVSCSGMPVSVGLFCSFIGLF
jgi:hypothetical protein